MRIRLPLLTAAALAVAAGGAAPAHASLPLLGNLGQTVTTVTNTLPLGGTTANSVLPDLGGAVTQVTGTVGGLVTGTTSTLTGALQGTLDQVTGTAGGLLPTDLLTLLLGPAGGAVNGASTSGPGTGAGSTTGAVVDGRAPNAGFRILSSLKSIARTGKLRLRVSMDEAGVAVFSSAVRPGRQTKRAKRMHPRDRHSRKVVHFPTAALAFRGSGALKVTIRLSRRVQRRLGRSRDARMALSVVTADLSRNQSASRQKKHLHR